MDIDRTIVKSIEEEFGQRAATSAMERELYSRDLAPVPELLVKPLFNTVPDIVVRPSTTGEISKLMRLASKERIPVTPRAGGSTVFFDSVPVRGGILMDLNLITGVVSLSEADMTVRVRAATTWIELERYLNARGFACKSMPSSAPAATVGGWFSMMGYGIGSLRYGSMLSQVKSAEAVCPDGSIVRVTGSTDPSLDRFSSAEGTIGVITEIELEIRRLTDMKHFLVHVADNREAVSLIDHVIRGSVMPYNIHFSEQSYVMAMKKLGYSHADVKPGCMVAVDFEGSDDDLGSAAQQVTSIVHACKSAELLPEKTADAEWEERFSSLRLKRGGPSMLGAEIWLPLARLAEYLAGINKMSGRYGVELLSYGHVVSREHATVMTAFFADETRTIPYIISLSLVKKIQDLGYRLGGCPYGVGLWNTPYIGRIHSSPRLTEIREQKRKIDPAGIMNPGKVYRYPMMLNPLVFFIGMEALAFVRRIFGRKW